VSGEDTYKDSVMGCVGGRLHLVCTATVAVGVKIPIKCLLGVMWGIVIIWFWVLPELLG
jgi:hypothetical protein